MRLLRKNLPFLLMGAPGFLLLVVFSYLPMFGVIIAFKNYWAVQGVVYFNANAVPTGRINLCCLIT
jgi:putative aldouronate transport system permease protein